jgi:DNA-binding response OmpR family regulator
MDKFSAKILLAEDDFSIRYTIKDVLGLNSYHVMAFEDGEQALESFNSQKFDLCLLDITLPKKDGYEIAREIRKKDKSTPIIFLTSRDQKEDKIQGFMAGADDYITKPFIIEELLLRIEAVLRRTKSHHDSIDIIEKREVYPIGKYTLDYNNKTLLFEKAEQNITIKEANLLKILIANKNKAVSREFLLKNVWNQTDYFAGRSMDVYITKLRKYLSKDPGISIVNAFGAGFRLDIK